MKTLLKSLLDKYRLQIGIFLVAATVVGGGVLALTTNGSKTSEIERIAGADSPVNGSSETTASSTPVPAVAKIKIDIAGAVANPGVYELSADARVEDGLAAAGGLSDEADQAWVAKNLNLATKLSDGDKLYIPKVEEGAPPSSAGPGGVVSGTETSPASNCSRVNINSASAAVLADCLSGIGEKRAKNIVSYRESHGGFKNIEEIKNVTNIAEGIFSQIKDQIVVD